MAVNEFVLTSSYVQIASVKSTLSVTKVASGRQGQLSVAENMAGNIPYSCVLKPCDQLDLRADKDYFARSLDDGGMTIRVEDDT